MLDNALGTLPVLCTLLIGELLALCAVIVLLISVKRKAACGSLIGAYE